MKIEEIKTFKGKQKLYIHTHTGPFGVVKSFSLNDDIGYKRFFKKLRLESIDEGNYLKLYEYKIIDETDENFIVFKFLDGLELKFSLNITNKIYSNVEYPNFN